MPWIFDPLSLRVQRNYLKFKRIKHLFLLGLSLYEFLIQILPLAQILSNFKIIIGNTPMKNKIIFYALLASLFSVPYPGAHASQRMDDDASDNTAAIRRVVTTGLAAPFHDNSSLDTLPLDMKVTIARFFDAQKTLGGTLVKFSLVSKSCHAVMLVTLPFYDLRHVAYIDNLTPDILEVLKRFRTISYMFVTATDTIMKDVAQLRNIKRLDLTGSGITRNGLIQLPQLSAKLKKLHLFDFEPIDALADDYAASFGALTSLVSFSFSRSTDYDSAEPPLSIAAAISGLTSLTQLCFCEVRDFNDECTLFLTHATKLQYLSLRKTSVTNAIFPHLTNLTNLKELFVAETNIRSEDEAWIKSLLPKLKKLHI